jgi:hypothetical protein
VQVAEGEFLFVAHLQQGSVAVRPGDTIDAGQTLGRVGNSSRTHRLCILARRFRCTFTDIGWGTPSSPGAYRPVAFNEDDSSDRS